MLGSNVFQFDACLNLVLLGVGAFFDGELCCTKLLAVWLLDPGHDVVVFSLGVVYPQFDGLKLRWRMEEDRE